MQRTLRTVLLAGALLLTISNNFAADVSAVWDGTSFGVWSDAQHWSSSPNYPNNVGGITYDATIDQATVSLDQNITIQRLILDDAELDGSGFTLTLNEGLTAISSSLGVGTLNLAAGSTSTIFNCGLNGTVNNAGTVDNGAAAISGTINNLAGATWTTQWGINPANGMLTPPAAGQFNNLGTLIVDLNGSPFGTSYMRTRFNNFGDVTITGSGDFFVLGGSAVNGAFNLGAQSGVTFENYTIGYGTTINGGTVTVDQALNVAGYVTINSDLVNHGTLSVQQGATLNLNGTLDLAAAIPFLQGSHAGIVQLGGGTIVASQPLNLTHGIVAGWGTINGNLSLSDSAIVSLQLAGTMPGSGGNHYDSLRVNGTTTLGGTLGVSFANGFENSITSSNTFTVLALNPGYSGSFDNAINDTRMDTADYLGTFLVNYGNNNLTLSNFVPNTRWLGGSGKWSDASKWLSNPAFPNDNGSTHYSVVIRDDDSIELDTDVTLSRFFVTGGNFGGSHAVTVTGNFVWTGGSIGSVAVAAGSTAAIATSPLAPDRGRWLYSTLTNFGTVNQSSFVENGLSGLINNMAGATWNVIPASVNYSQSPASFHGTFNNFGNLVVDGRNSPVSYSVITFNNNGHVELLGNSTFGFSSGKNGDAINSGSFDLGRGSSLNITQLELAAGSQINGLGAVQMSFDSTMNINGDSTIGAALSMTSGRVNIASGANVSLNGTVTSDSGRINLMGNARLTLNGTLMGGSNITGIAAITGQDIRNNGTISPGFDLTHFGQLTINGHISLLSNSRLEMEIGGLAQDSQHDQLLVNGSIALDGTLVLQMVSPSRAQRFGEAGTFSLLTSNNLTGAFDNVANGERLTTSDGAVSFQVNYGPGSLFDPNDLVLSDPEIVPEPASCFLFAVGMVLLGCRQLRARRRSSAS